MTRPTRVELAAECDELRAALYAARSVIEDVLDEEDEIDSDEDAEQLGDEEE